MKARNDWVDCAKGIGIILVVYGHVARGLINAGLPIDANLFSLVDSIIYSFHMPLFFFLSGLFFFNSLEKWGGVGLVVSKVDAILYPYVLWSILQGVIEVILSNYTNGSLTYGEVFSFAWHPRAQFWFLYVLFFIFAIFSMFCTFSIKPQPMYLFFFAIVLYGMGIYFPGLLSGGITNNAIYFALGAWCYVFNELLFERRVGLFLFFLTVFVFFQYIFHIVLKLNYTDKGLLRLILSLTSISFIVFLAMCLSELRVKWLLFIGSSSMAIYLMHILAGSGTRVILKNLLGIQSTSLHLVVGTFLGVAMPLVALFIINRYKLNFLIRPPKFLSLSRYYKN